MLDKFHKLFHLLRLLVVEVFAKRNVVFMSAFFDDNYRFLKQNWGDDINWWFLREICVTPIVSYDWSLMARYLGKENYRVIGSILSMQNTPNSVVWGSGFIDETSPLAFTPKRVLAVRGPLTRKRLLDQGIDCPEIYGDPALLLPKYYQPQVQKKYKLGIVAHYVDQSNPLLESLRNDKEVLMIDIKRYDHWLDIIDQICQCEVIASSSLHGLIVSEAYDIPNVWMKLKGSELLDDIKYHDFFLSLGRDRDPLVVSHNIEANEVLNEALQWERGTIDLTPLIKACPFELKQNINIKR